MQVANEAWEAMYRAHTRLQRALSDSAIWEDLQPNEYAVLYALSSKTDGKRITELTQDVLLTQPGLSRLIARLESQGLIVRVLDDSDGRASLIQLTDDGRQVQRRVGSAHAREVMLSMTSSLNRTELADLRDLCRKFDEET
ncbi:MULTISPECIES: MarR family winged helix-turn-helix transcriptional regulator [unclassified Rhodococcus (in: high G+C Gram-positive bacteria)]|uniref:MarR family winged helix-turn-helix transcriptional regulator n=1 Tax=unclassified Rhodococcus (in: high G+C Gram-positive bacteria) TaxID=192944 RepID=UPI0015C5E743|nr:MULTISPECIES: MarR family transcriptional regulator [unclassified Rhodococcus (in: high G+C Gram-positive bacteria)]